MENDRDSERGNKRERSLQRDREIRGSGNQ